MVWPRGRRRKAPSWRGIVQGVVRREEKKSRLRLILEETFATREGKGGEKSTFWRRKELSEVKEYCFPSERGGQVLSGEGGEREVAFFPGKEREEGKKERR